MFGEEMLKIHDDLSESCKKMQIQYQQLQKTLEKCSSLSTKLVSDCSAIGSQKLSKNMLSYKNANSLIPEANLGALSKVMSMVSGFFNNARANGGNVSQSVPYLVGERGPEIFVPNSGGKIISNGGSAGGKAVNIVMNINTPDVVGFNKSRNQIVSELARAMNGTKNV